MGQDKTELVHLLNFVKEIYKNTDNKEFAAGIQAMVLEDDLEVKKDLDDIREALHLRGKESIDYSFVNDEIVRNQLRVDNLRMENVALDLKLTDGERFNSFCINAFLQVENLANYFYITMYDNDLADVLSEIEDATQNDKYPFKRTGYEKKIGDIAIASKISAFSNRYFPYDAAAKIYDYTGSALQKLRLIRNDNFHRGGIGEAAPEDKKPYGTENDYRETLKTFVAKVKDLLISNR